MDRPEGELVCLRPVRHRQVPLRRGSRASRRRCRDERRLVHHRRPRRAGARHRVDDSIARALARIIRSDLVIVDDIGLLPVSTNAAEGFYRLVDAAYERRSLAVSSNLHPSGFDEIMPKTLATATVDRLLHHAHIVTQGDSHRRFRVHLGRRSVRQRGGPKFATGKSHSPLTPEMKCPVFVI
ncbi:ATP-binding protein [Nonomuraea sp. NPDC048826]|uniref:ATP-binding protein n=1 Tax=Nonomuraea sp. NPDC048826 TaxID=3364347 RepID=UPI00371F388E